MDLITQLNPASAAAPENLALQVQTKWEKLWLQPEIGFQEDISAFAEQRSEFSDVIITANDVLKSAQKSRRSGWMEGIGFCMFA